MNQVRYAINRFFTLLSCTLFFYQSNAQAPQQPTDDLKLWFSHPAANWNEALPVGNGRLGAMVFGGVNQERLQLNEETVWTGKDIDFVNPEAAFSLAKARELLFAGKYGEAEKLAQKSLMGERKTKSSYQTLGDLQLDFGNMDGNLTEYRRELDLETAVTKVTYRSNRVLYTREVFASAPDQALVTRLTADKPGSLTFSLQLSRPGNKAKLEVVNNEIIMSEHVGDGVGVKMVARVKVLNEGGKISATGSIITVDEADAVILLLTAATDYRGGDPAKLSGEKMLAVEKRKYSDVKKDHMADYQQYFKRVDLDLGKTDAVYFATDSRVAAMQNGNVDPQLLKIYYQFGRYLLISSSRPGTLPANLQGIWADGLTPPWSADYHININIQMNYWLAESTNLPEPSMPKQTFNALYSPQ